MGMVVAVSDSNRSRKFGHVVLLSKKIASQTFCRRWHLPSWHAKRPLEDRIKGELASLMLSMMVLIQWALVVVVLSTSTAKEGAMNLVVVMFFFCNCHCCC